MPLGYLLKHYRQARGLSQRKLGEISGVDHGHIYRLEMRSKSPSAEMVQKLVRGLGLTGRDAWLLPFVGKYGDYVNIAMVKYALAHPKITEEEFSWAVALKFRSPEKLDCPRLFGCAQRIVEVVDRYLEN